MNTARQFLILTTLLFIFTSCNNNYREESPLPTKKDVAPSKKMKIDGLYSIFAQSEYTDFMTDFRDSWNKYYGIKSKEVKPPSVRVEKGRIYTVYATDVPDETVIVKDIVQIDAYSYKAKRYVIQDKKKYYLCDCKISVIKDGLIEVLNIPKDNPNGNPNINTFIYEIIEKEN